MFAFLLIPLPLSRPRFQRTPEIPPEAHMRKHPDLLTHFLLLLGASHRLLLSLRSCSQDLY